LGVGVARDVFLGWHNTHSLTLTNSTRIYPLRFPRFWRLLESEFLREAVNNMIARDLPDFATPLSCSNGAPMRKHLKECAFCLHTAKLSAEHIFGSWVSALLPGPKRVRFTDNIQGISNQWVSSDLDLKPKVVCKKCNETWMSDIENLHAKPIMTHLIKGDLAVPLNRPESRSLAIFAFKTAVVLDHSRRDREPFFSHTLRHAFRESFAIPDTVQMWMCAFAPNRLNLPVLVNCGYYKSLTPSDPFQMYICTCGIGKFAFQVIAAKDFVGRFAPLPGFDHLLVDLWPRIPPGFVWPPQNGLVSKDHFYELAKRWESIAPID
jgi:hypothetical protein